MSEEEAIERLKERVKLDRKIRNNKTESDYEQFCENECQAIEAILNLADKQQKEIEEKTTILLAGAEKVKQLEKGNRSLMESRIKWKNRYYKEKAKNKECISKDKIREKIKEVQETVCPNCCACGLCDEFKELLEEN